ncbi:MAG: MupG family TIM beta-alpha barrel fold protein [Lactobacillaceae bacterium]|jgi:hypothetical protein|nr:MupG family TIM beta-alpha barrel fold protein [Lactobacillaceae bacterium]
MGTLGVSIYPSKTSIQAMQDYLDLAAGLGYTRIFTSMLEVAEQPAKTLELFKTIIEYGNSLGMATTIDINPALFKTLNIAYEDLSLFKQLGASAIRLDEGFTGLEEARMTHNQLGLKIELNISRGQHYIEMVTDFGPNQQQLIGSHNFYPQLYTGLDADYMVAAAAQYKALNLPTAAFVDTPSGQIGPWPNSDLMVTTEIQRTMPIASQVRYLKAVGVIDDILIASSQVSEADLKAVAAAFYEPVTGLTVELADQTSAIEAQIVYDEMHLYRGDYSGYMMRSSQTRVKFKAEAFPPHDVQTIQAGDITIGNDTAGQYKGELQVALKTRPNNGQHNVVGHVITADLPLLPLIKPWHSFKLVR